MNEGKDHGMGDSIALSAHLREANTSQQNKNPQRTEEAPLPYKSGQPARLFVSFL